MNDYTKYDYTKCIESKSVYETCKRKFNAGIRNTSFWNSSSDREHMVRATELIVAKDIMLLECRETSKANNDLRQKQDKCSAECK